MKSIVELHQEEESKESKESKEFKEAEEINLKFSKDRFDIKSILRNNILNLKPYRCARDDYSKGILLDANENSLGNLTTSNSQSISDSTTTTTTTTITNSDSTIINISSNNPTLNLDNLKLNRYPSPYQKQIKINLANHQNSLIQNSNLSNLNHSNIFLGVGSDEILDLLFRIVCQPGHSLGHGDKVIITPPTYGMYSVCANLNDVGIINLPLLIKNNDFILDLSKLNSLLNQPNHHQIKLIFICSPGNPTGTTIPISSIIQILSNHNFKGLLVVDEAYIDFAGYHKSAIQLIRQGWKNLIVTQTLSKGFGLAGIRLGIAYGSPDLIQILNNSKAPYSISSLTSVVAQAATSPQALIKSNQNVQILVENRHWLKSQLINIKGLGQILGATEANFILIQVLKYSHDNSSFEPDSLRAKKVYKYMAELKESDAVVVRYRGDDHGCQGALRITIGTRQECQKVVQILSQALDLIH
ncbi:hypothetical protein O181_089523 [Austropuccinia psidii MF-1]|uniref:histidinol-phosphate transaminase n=1 Tax=Austropuccinia psidii MF-1 TaxID=1389203 RepID=A0A9Q3ITN9_9BASI|nr:hypothetical protein [Austropuccinia psidii MF-1]